MNYPVFTATPSTTILFTKKNGKTNQFLKDSEKNGWFLHPYCEEKDGIRCGSEKFIKWAENSNFFLLEI